MQAIHQLFRRREPTIASALLTLATADAAAFALLERLDLGLPLRTLASVLGVSTVVTLFASIVVYRLSPWHPLARYPGPALRKVSQARTILAAKRGVQYLELKQLHEQHGSIVRTGACLLRQHRLLNDRA